MKKYDHKKIEAKWQKRWEKEKASAAHEDANKKKYYILDMFPYPSAAGLHVGHPEGYTATDIIARKRRMEGWNALHPMGWDAFGLPTENYAIKVGKNPKEIAAANIKNFRRQIKSLGFSYDWEREINTSAPEYYKWTQWFFLHLYKRGLAYKKLAPVNWCEHCQTVLANEQVVDGVCERCHNLVVQKELKQWFFKITEYAERLLSGLDNLDWPEKIKTMQRNWIGKSEGVIINFRGVHKDIRVKTKAKLKVEAEQFEIPVFTTRADTFFGVSYIVLAPEHPLVARIVSADAKAEAEKYIEMSRGKSELERAGLEAEKTGVSLGASITHPLTGEEIPVWISDYVLLRYGTGAVMGVPAHDERDFVFAKKYGLTIKHVVVPPHDVSEAMHEAAHHGGQIRNPKHEILNKFEARNSKQTLDSAYIEPGYLVNSAEFSGLTSEDAKQKIASYLESKGLGTRQTFYHLRDWLVSRQRYWGAPIPIICCVSCGEAPVPEEDLPVLLPDDVDFRPTGESPLARSKSFHKVKCPRCGKKARREADTMDTFVDSSWYYLRYSDPQNDSEFAASDKLGYWCPVDLYVGGAEHAVLHLLYARFFTKVLFDAKLISFDESFLRLRNQGLILGTDGQKMSKSRGNVINPDDVVGEYGADSTRLYEMFMGDFEEAKPWSTKGILGVSRFIERVFKLCEEGIDSKLHEDSATLTRLLHKTVKKVTEDIENFKFNTAISAMMILSNEWQKHGTVSRHFAETFLKTLSPFAPHIAEELWESFGHKSSIFKEAWPSFSPELARDEEVTIIVQINGKMRERLTVPVGATEEEVKKLTFESEKVKQWIAGKEIKQVVFVANRLINFVL